MLSSCISILQLFLMALNLQANNVCYKSEAAFLSSLNIAIEVMILTLAQFILALFIHEPNRKYACRLEMWNVDLWWL